MKKIKFVNYEWYLIKLEGINQYFSPSGYCIVQYMDGLLFTELKEIDISDFKYKIIKHLSID